MSTAEDRQLRRRAEQLATLAGVEAFQALQRDLAAKAERMRQALVNRLLSGEDVALLQRQADYDRGFVAGMEYPGKVVAGAAAKLSEQDLVEPVTAEEDGWDGFQTEQG